MRFRLSRSRDGANRFTVRVNHRLTLKEAADILCNAYRDGTRGQAVPPELLKGISERVLRSELWTHGVQAKNGEWRVGLEPEEEAAWEAWGARQVLQLLADTAAAEEQHPDTQEA